MSTLLNYFLDLDIDDFMEEGNKFGFMPFIFGFLFVLVFIVIMIVILKTVYRQFKSKTNISYNKTIDNHHDNLQKSNEDNFCEYCGGMIPKEKAECPYCGAKRKKK